MWLEKEIRDYPIDRDFYNECKTRVNLARKINETEHRRGKTHSESNWYRKHAKMLDIELDDEILKETHVDEEESSREKNKLRQMREELKRMLGSNSTIIPKSMSRKYLNETTISRVKSINRNRSIYHTHNFYDTMFLTVFILRAQSKRYKWDQDVVEKFE